MEGKTIGKYKTGDVYSYLKGPHDEVNWASIVWSPHGVPRHNFLVWLATLDRCPTKDRMISWGLQVSSLCPLCNAAGESRDHLFPECSFSFDLWSLCAPRCGITPIRQWDRTLTQMRNLRRNKAQRPLRTLTLLVWQAVIYWIWAERNARLHSNNFKSADSLFSTIDRQIRNKIQTLRESNPSLCSAISQLWFTHA
ncbi:uncharacterized protein LOC106413069 [Brassica napus]|uniref:uncharacterized protein LOC106413069 n=1 Tax=Brassica napus TaxID=3708 RepID=UPI0006AAEFE0|nr:uncharacterized protein LOC106413069 [Brassica napus]